jgi:hypothetical protein
MATNNACNYKPTQHCVQVGGTNGTLVDVTNGTTGQVLTAVTGADPTFQASVSGITAVNIQTFTASGTYTPTIGMRFAKIECIGGGGAGGGAKVTGAATVNTASGGGSGEYAQGTFSATTIGASQSVTIGAAGTANSGASGGNGGNTSVGSTVISANGGVGGVTGGTSSISNSNGSLGGTGGTGGDFRTPGQPGFFGGANTGATALIGGQGGSSVYGAGGLTPVSGTANQGGAGLGYGSGGGGSCNYINQAAALLGGAGAKGVVIITEYF